jgi:peroxiredoxin
LKEIQRPILSTATETISFLFPAPSAPDLTLPVEPGENISLKGYGGQPFILVLHPPDWDSTCGDQVVFYHEILTHSQNNNAQVVSLSMNGIRSHFAFPLDHKIRLIHPLFVTDSEGIIDWHNISPGNFNPGVNGILTTLEGRNA